MKNKTSEQKKAIRVMQEKLSFNNNVLKELKNFEQNGLLEKETLSLIKKEKIKKNELEILVSKTLGELIYLKNAFSILLDIKNDVTKLLEILKIIETTKTKNKPTNTYLNAWAEFIKLRLKNSKNPSLKEFENMIEEKSIHIEPDTARKYWREFRKKIDSSSYLIELLKNR